MWQISNSKQAAYLMRTTHKRALIGNESRAYRATASMARRPTRMSSNNKTKQETKFLLGLCSTHVQMVRMSKLVYF